MNAAQSRFDNYYMPEPNTGCFLWLGYVQKNGYGGFSLQLKGERIREAHRIAYILFIGPIPKGKEIDHKCRVRSCVNPGHLEAVSHRENCLRGASEYSRRAFMTHCFRGHALSGWNLIRKTKTRRNCRKCAYIRAAIGRKKKKDNYNQTKGE